MEHETRPHGFAGFLLGIVFTLAALFAGGYVYLRYGHPPVAVSDTPFPNEAKIVHIPLNARIDREIAKPPFTATHADLVAGAKIYAGQCAFCHGVPGQDSTIGPHEYPISPQLFKAHGHSGVVGVSDDEPGETYWKIDNGIRLTGMPAFNKDLSQDDMWRVTLLLKQADQPLDPEVATALHGSLAAKP